MLSRSPKIKNPADQGANLRVGLDVTSLLAPVTGVGTFAREVLNGLAASPSIDVAGFAVSLRGMGRLRSVVPAGASASYRPLPARVARAAWLRADSPTVEDLVGRVDVVHGPNFVVPPARRAVEVVTIHDLTAVRYPEMCTGDVLQWPPLLRRALGRGAWVHCVSEFVAGEVRDAFPEVGERVVVVANGVNAPPPVTARSGADRGRHLAGSDRYVLAVGTVEPRKDLSSLVAAFDAMAAHDRDLRLVFAGPDGWGAADLTAAIDAAAHGRRIIRLGWVDDETRYALMRGASVVAYPSRYEGFGLVPLDAMSVGTPVVATNAGAVAEVVGDAALLVPVGDVDALAAALTEVLEEPEVVQRLVAAGTDRVSRYSWSRTVDGVIDLYRGAVAGRG